MDETIAMSWSLSTDRFVEEETEHNDYCYADPDGLPPAAPLVGDETDEDADGYSYGIQGKTPATSTIGDGIRGDFATNYTVTPQVPDALVNLFKEISENKAEDLRNTGAGSWSDKAYLYRGPVEIRLNDKLFSTGRWKTRYMVSLTRYLLVYINKDSSKPWELISLRNYHKVERQRDVKKRDFAFRLSSQCGEKEWTFSTESFMEMKSFMHCIEGSIDFLGKGKLTETCVKEISALKNLDDQVVHSRYSQFAELDAEEISYVFPPTMSTNLVGYANDPDRPYDTPTPSQDYPDTPQSWQDYYDQLPTYGQLSVLSNQFGCEWKSFAREHLNLTRAEIDQCLFDNAKIIEQVLAALVMWKKKNPNCCTIQHLLEKLSAAPLAIEYSDFAFLDPEGRYDPRSPTTQQYQSYGYGTSTQRTFSTSTLPLQLKEESNPKVTTRRRETLPRTGDSKQDLRPPMPTPKPSDLKQHSEERSRDEQPPKPRPCTLRQPSTERSHHERQSMPTLPSIAIRQHTAGRSVDQQPPIPKPKPSHHERPLTRNAEPSTVRQPSADSSHNKRPVPRPRKSMSTSLDH